VTSWTITWKGTNYTTTLYSYNGATQTHTWTYPYNETDNRRIVVCLDESGGGCVLTVAADYFGDDYACYLTGEIDPAAHCCSMSGESVTILSIIGDCEADEQTLDLTANCT